MQIKSTLVKTTKTTIVAKIATLILALTAPSTVSAQIPSIQWQKTVGGSQNDNANSVIPTKDGGYIVAGTTVSTDFDLDSMGVMGADCLVYKLDATGNMIWKKRYGGSTMDWGDMIKPTADNGYVLMSSSASNDGDVTNHHGNPGIFDIRVLKLDSVGNIQWERSYGGNADDLGTGIVVTDDGGYGVIGYTSSHLSGDVDINKGVTDMWVLRLDSIGNIIWQKTYGGSGLDAGHGISNTKAGGFVLAGHSSSRDGDVSGHYGSFLDRDAWALVVDSVGNIVWEKNYGGLFNESFVSVAETNEGGFIFAGNTNSNSIDVSGLHPGFNPISGKPQPDYWVVKTSISGAIEWQKCLGGSQVDYGSRVLQTNDGGYLVTGEARSPDGNVSASHNVFMASMQNYTSDFWIAKLGPGGNLEWNQSLGGAGREITYGFAITPDNGYIIVGSSDSLSGDVTKTYSRFPRCDQWLVKLSPMPTTVAPVETNAVTTVYPNPAVDILHIRSSKRGTPFQINNIMGQMMYNGTFNDEVTEVDISKLPPGTYYLKIEHGHSEFHKISKTQ